jgi:hypothetical protein
MSTGLSLVPNPPTPSHHLSEDDTRELTTILNLFFLTIAEYRALLHAKIDGSTPPMPSLVNRCLLTEEGALSRSGRAKFDAITLVLAGCDNHECTLSRAEIGLDCITICKGTGILCTAKPTQQEDLWV